MTGNKDIISLIEDAGIEYVDLRDKKEPFGLLAARNYRNLLIHVTGLDMNLRLFLPEERQRIVAPVGGLREVENNG